MRSLALTLVSALLVAGCGGGPGPKQPRVSIQIQLHTYSRDAHPKRQTLSFSLACRPTSGTLPLAARVCLTISRYPRAMLDPGQARSLCSGRPFGPDLTVSAAADGRRTSFGGEPSCNWPGGTALAIYWAATQEDEHVLDRFEPRLRCDEDPALLARPTPHASVVACVRGLWTPRSERLIRVAARVPSLALLHPRALFPHNIGARRCTIPAGGPPVRTLHGLCGVYLKHVWSRPTVTFVETWPRAHKGTARHSWRVAVQKGRPTLVSERGPPPPQLWK